MCKMMVKIITIFLLIVAVSSCYFGQPVDVVVADQPFTLHNNQIEIQCDPPLRRTRNSGSIQIMIQESWAPQAPWKQIKFDDGTIVSIDVVLQGDDGKDYTPNIIGSAVGRQGKFLDVRYDPPTPKNVKIHSMKLSANHKLTINKIIWHNFDPT